MEKKDGGSAFPTDHFVVAEHPEKDCTQRVFLPGSGMTLRDYFAAAALTGMLSSCNGVGTAEDGHLSKWAYEHADAMIAARDK